MSKKKTEDGTGSEIIYHFKVAQHRLPLTLSIETEQATKDILDNFNRQFFDGKLKYNLYVVPSEEGGFVKAFRIILLGSSILGTAAVIMNNLGQFLDTRTGEFMYEKYIGEPLPWLKEKIDKNDTDHKSDEGIKAPVLSKEEVESVLSVLPSYLLSEDVENLKAAGITPNKFPKAFKARNKFYKTCMKNKEIQGLSFDRSHDFLLKKESFEELIVKIPDDFTHNIVDIVVSSPNWKTTGRGWQTSKLITFHIDDEKFWKTVDNKTITPHVKDKMQVQWIYEDNKIRPQKVRVLRVISYNGAPISKQLSEKKIQKICDDKNAFSEEQEQAKSLNNKSNLLTDLHDDNKNDSDD